MHPIVLLIALATFCSTLVGGLVALRLKDKLHLILGFSAGAVIAVAFFDLMPEAIGIGSKYYAITTIPSIVALGFLVYLVLDRVVFLHSHADDHDDAAHVNRGILGAGSLSIHSFLDGVAIGLAFQVSAAIGAVVAIAVLVHDFSDGINTVNLILKNKGKGARAFRWLVVDAVAPVIGVISTFFFTLPESALAVILAVFSGFFLYIGASDLIPESHHGHPKFLTTAMTVLGAGILYVAIHVANL
ncbi:MAG: ZIP family metal transporter [Candidatus Pacebacteria bacterium]|nr:ZIP family metal transporter [Candidatus Paceibacterota bacterium]